MRKTVSSLLILILLLQQTMLFAEDAPKDRPTLSDKMNQPIYIPDSSSTGGSTVPPGSSTKKIDTSRPLWFESNNKDTAEYAELIVMNAPKELGDTAVVAYGSLGSDSVVSNFGTNEKPNMVDMVSSSIEYYFTNKVFIEKQYKAALIDLLQYRAEVPAKQQAVDETAIPGTLWVAEQNGVKISMDDVKKEFITQNNAQIDQYAKAVIDFYKGSVKGVDKYINEYADALKAYYADPLPSDVKLDFLINKGMEINNLTKAASSGAVGSVYIDWGTLMTLVVGKMSVSLATTLTNRLKERTAQASAAALNPVEVRTRDASAALNLVER